MGLSRWTAVVVGALAAAAAGSTVPVSAGRGLNFPASPPGLGAFDKLAALQCPLPTPPRAEDDAPCRRVLAVSEMAPAATCLPAPADVCPPPTYGRVYLGGGDKVDDLSHALPYDRHAWRSRLDMLRRGPLQPGWVLRSKRVAHPAERGDARARWLPAAARLAGDALLHEREVASHLALTRNTFSASIQRVTGKYDVLSVTRLSAGVCADANCSATAAVDVAGAAIDDFGGGRLPILTAPVGEDGRQSRARAPVAMQDADVLALGRAVLADPTWLGAPADGGPWRLRARVEMSTACHAGGAMKNDMVPRRFRNDTTGRWTVGWQLGNATTRRVSALWLQAVASLACRQPAWLPRQPPLCAAPAAAARGWRRLRAWRPARGVALRNCGATWFLRPPTVAAAAANGSRGGGVAANGSRGGGAASRRRSACRRPLRPRVRPYRPPWVTGLGGREINPRSAAEAALATRVAACPEAAAAGAAFWAGRLRHGGWAESYTALEAPRQGSGHHFDPSLFNVDPPAGRASAIDIVLSLIVVLPEAAALAVQAVTPAGRYSAAAMVATFFVGLVSLSGVAMLAVQEVGGARFHAAADLDWLTLPATPAVAAATPAARNLAGAPLVRAETLLLVRTVGYRPRLLVALAAAAAAAYLATSAAAFGTAAALRRRRGRVAAAGGRRGHRGGSSAATWGSAPRHWAREDPPSPAEAVASWWLRHSPGRRGGSRQPPTTGTGLGPPLAAAATPQSAPPG